MKHCLSCGAELLPPSEICPACRAPQSAALYVPVPATSVFDPPVVAPTAGFIPSQPAASPGTPAAPRPAARDTPEVRTRRTIILVSVLVLLLVLGLAAYAVGRGGTAENAVDTVASGTGGDGTRFSPVPA
ncbi:MULTISPECIES: hypothetical protein [unclassified Arthrobacter]|uniref:hypothetical protein n=1 Tax=unclassified Arthrobacter TaxID=235627 RepID=UPI001E45F00C|nr:MULTISPECIES: hypothetical protein [unclassified Arthrobacter]MCC9145966.1 hypothetical protein [Arthrobacter sp. zg-Y919]MDK1277195.1 hypothetical protein [Arthrobacter sp. zg.Y919]WIB03709.1 hypothetical protein QNO10_03240 [Arthrobacter sp. zg-Y919]